jgi:uncharacterized protein (TIGR03083 family)
MEITDHVEILRREGQSLVKAAEEAGVGAAVPTCPGWQVRDLLRHIGTVHRWAEAFVDQGMASPRSLEEEPGLDGPELLAWYSEEHRKLTATLDRADPAVECWHFLPAPSPLAFWARRQAHETTVHRLDAEAARGGEPAPVAVEFAVDGIDELLTGFHGRRSSRLRSPEPKSLRVRATDLAEDDAVWTVRISTAPPVTVRGAADLSEADCEVSGPAARLYAALWNRTAFPSVTGDPTTAALWRETAAIG